MEEGAEESRLNTLPELLDGAVRSNPQKAAVIDGERKLSYLGLQERVQSLSHRLSTLGVKRGDPVALLLPNGAEFVVSFFAIARLGGIVVPLNSHYQQTELSFFVGDCRPAALITLQEFAGLCRGVLAGLRYRCDLLILEERWLWAAPISEGESSAIRGSIERSRPGDSVIYQYTSGSTGNPKRVARTHSNLTFELESLAKTLGLSREDRFLGVVPFSHVNGLVRSMLASLSVGATLVPLREFKRQKLAHTIQQERITVFIGVPFMFNILAEMNFREPVDFSSLRLCVSASAPMPAATNRRFREKYGLYVRQLYGSTETGSISVNMGKDIENSLESVGLPIDGVEVEVFRDGGALADHDEVGEVAVKSPAAITRYDGASGTQEPFRDGYFFTGDLARIHDRGYLCLVGRKKFFINKGGYKINPWEVENLIGGYAKVGEVVVIGVPTTYGDEAVKAVVVTSEPCTEEEIIEYCRGKIADFKVPSLIEFRQDLPKSPTGKVLRNKLQ
jgi:long-chain acyl-CoA synthetase